METSFFTPVLVSFGISVLLCPVFIPFLRRLHIGQQIRENGPKEHLKKTGTPTMGGIVILLAVLFTSLGYAWNYPDIIPVLFATLGFGLVGFLDDYIKVVKKRSLGLKPVQKLLLECIVTAVFACYCMGRGAGTASVLLPFSGGFEQGVYLNLGICFVPFLFLTMLGTVNGANFTDGLDGLVSGVTLMIALFLSVTAAERAKGISVAACAVSGALIGFLVYNIYPARVFMGDTGSLALGGFVAASAFLLQIPLFIVMIGIVYFAEVLSVILQVFMFRLCHGKRLFKMAPVHHHFELCGWQETKIAAVFITITALGCVLAFLGM